MRIAREHRLPARAAPVLADAPGWLFLPARENALSATALRVALGPAYG
jgi:hypothetical protein